MSSHKTLSGKQITGIASQVTVGPATWFQPQRHFSTTIAALQLNAVKSLLQQVACVVKQSANLPANCVCIIKRIKSGFKKHNKAFSGRLYSHPQSSSTVKDLRTSQWVVPQCYMSWSMLYFPLFWQFSTACSGKFVVTVNWTVFFNCTACLKDMWLKF